CFKKCAQWRPTDRAAGLTRGSFVGTFSSNSASLVVLELACYSSGLETQLSVAFCRSDKQAATVSELGSAEQAIRLIVAEPSGRSSRRDAAVISYVDAIAKGRELLQQRREKENSGDGQQQEDADANRRPQPSATWLACTLVTDTIKEDTFKLTCRWRTSWSECGSCSLRHACPWDSFGDRAGLMDDLRECQPTFMAAVPKSRGCRSSGVDKDTLWDRLVFRRVQEGLGGRVRFVALAGADFCGHAETLVSARRKPAASACASGPATRPATTPAGRPMLGIEVRLADAPDADCPNAEADAGALAETLDSDGWVHTGDIAQLLPGGSYRIVDRVKHLFKLAQGEYIAPEKIELVYCLNPAIDQVFVDGRSERSCLLGVVVPTLDATKAWLAKNPADTAAAAGDSPPELLAAACGSAGFKAHCWASCSSWASRRGCRASSSAENDLMTPTMKLKRPQLRKRFADAFDAMYAEVEP
uniref:AMP-binding domain-containing protein n=1 Tax=Macrostomum lignano TaxID=282301 RepID=A0A1I8FIE3_9PLAT